MDLTLLAPLAAPETAHLNNVIPFPCPAHPGTRYVHLDGACGCFYGGPAPEMAAA